MFKNIGKKIMALAKVLCWFGIVVSLIAAVGAGLAAAQQGGSNVVIGLIGGIVVAVLGVLASWIGSFVLYGFGQLIDDTANIRKKIEE